jgi:hypothetical protein
LRQRFTHQAHECTRSSLLHVARGRAPPRRRGNGQPQPGGRPSHGPLVVTGRARASSLSMDRLQLPPVPPRAPSSHQASVPHPRTPRHRLSLRLWNLQNGRPFRRAPRSGILCLQSASSTVGASSICSLHHQPLGEEISREEQVLDLGLLAIVGGSRPLISVAEVERWLETNYAITPSSVTIS